LLNYLLQMPWLIPINYVNIFLWKITSSIYEYSLFIVGEAAGKALGGIIKKEDVNANINQLRGSTDSASSAIHDTRMVKFS
jgi:hypothetical protein